MTSDQQDLTQPKDLIIQPSKGLVSIPEGGSSALSEIINRSLVHIQASNALADSDPQISDEQLVATTDNVKRNDMVDKVKNLIHVPSSKTKTIVIPRPGDEREFEIDQGVKIVMCWIPPGRFLMGSPENEVGRSKNETQHLVEITQGFWLAKTLTTQAQWQAVMGNNPSHFKGGDLPVERVSWNDICGDETRTGGFLEAINWISTSDGCFHLPTEAQWEYACRAGTTGPHYGNLDEIAWYNANSGIMTHPVALKKRNNWGLHDMLGNVYEWCSDWLGPYPLGFEADPCGAVLGSYRVIRGGSWAGLKSNYWRVAERGCFTPSNAEYHVGFRLARRLIL